MISTTTRLVAAPSVIVQEAEDTWVLLHMDQGTYFSVNHVGGRAWQLIDGERAVARIVDDIAAEYDAPRDVVERDLLALFEELHDAKLVDCRNE